MSVNGYTGRTAAHQREERTKAGKAEEKKRKQDNVEVSYLLILFGVMELLCRYKHTMGCIGFAAGINQDRSGRWFSIPREEQQKLGLIVNAIRY